jgi:hypothetical protein
VVGVLGQLLEGLVEAGEGEEGLEAMME